MNISTSKRAPRSYRYVAGPISQKTIHFRNGRLDNFDVKYHTTQKLNLAQILSQHGHLSTSSKLENKIHGRTDVQMADI